MTICRLGSIVCTFGRDGQYHWTCKNQEVEDILNEDFILAAPPEDPDPFYTIAKKVCDALGMTIVKNVPPEVEALPPDTVV